jgi:hypothetical protein
MDADFCVVDIRFIHHLPWAHWHARRAELSPLCWHAMLHADAFLKRRRVATLGDGGCKHLELVSLLQFMLRSRDGFSRFRTSQAILTPRHVPVAGRCGLSLIGLTHLTMCHRKNLGTRYLPAVVFSNSPLHRCFGPT